MFKKPVFVVHDSPASLKFGIGLGVALAFAASAAAAYFYRYACAATPALPAPGRNKQNLAKLDKMHDQGVEDSMAASDPPSTVMPEVHQ